MNASPTSLCPECGSSTSMTVTGSGELTLAPHRSRTPGRRSHCPGSGAVVEPLPSIGSAP